MHNYNYYYSNSIDIAHVIFLQILMSVKMENITAAAMPFAPTLLEAITVPAMLDTVELDLSVVRMIIILFIFTF